MPHWAFCTIVLLLAVSEYLSTSRVPQCFKRQATQFCAQGRCSARFPKVKKVAQGQGLAPGGFQGSPRRSAHGRLPPESAPRLLLRFFRFLLFWPTAFDISSKCHCVRVGAWQRTHERTQTVHDCGWSVQLLRNTPAFNMCTLSNDYAWVPSFSQ